MRQKAPESEWIGKAGMVRRGIEHYLGPGIAARSSIARQDRSWPARGTDVAARIEQVRLKDARVANSSCRPPSAFEPGSLASRFTPTRTSGRNPLIL